MTTTMNEAAREVPPEHADRRSGTRRMKGQVIGDVTKGWHPAERHRAQLDRSIPAGAAQSHCRAGVSGLPSPGLWTGLNPPGTGGDETVIGLRTTSRDSQHGVRRVE